MAIGWGECCRSNRKTLGRGSSLETGDEGLGASKVDVSDDLDELDEHEELSVSEDDWEITLCAEFSSSWLMPVALDDDWEIILGAESLSSFEMPFVSDVSDRDINAPIKSWG